MRSGETVYRRQGEDVHREHRSHLRGHYPVDRDPHSLLRALWYPRRLCRGPAGIRRGVHTGPTSPRDRSYPAGIGLFNTNYMALILTHARFPLKESSLYFLYMTHTVTSHNQIKSKGTYLMQLV